METQMQSKQSNEVANLNDAATWGGGQTLTSNDIVIGKILPLNYMSDKVKEKKGEYGEFRDTVTNKLFGDLKTPLEIIPFHMEKKWIEFDLISNRAGAKKREFKQVIPIIDNASSPGFNDNLPYVDEGNNLERDRIMDFYVLIPNEVKDGSAMPYIVSFRRTSLKAGKTLATQMFARNRKVNLSPAAVVMKLSGQDVTNDKGSYIVQNVEASRRTTNEELKEAFEWFNLVRGGKTRIDDTDYKEEAKVNTNKINLEEGDY